MRTIVLLLLSISLINCEGKKTTKNKAQLETNKIEVKIKSKKKNTSYPRLTDDNVMEFFQDYDKKHKEKKVRLTTSLGKIEIQLFEETPYHRSNFIYLTKQKYFDGTQFYRVINNFMIQGGGTDDYEKSKQKSKIGKYLLPPDTKKGFKHDRGTVSMPSGEIFNSYKLASPFEFFIVQQKGGAHHLDGDYTVFGKVTQGMDVVDKIAAVETDDGDWPLRSVYIIKAEIID